MFPVLVLCRPLTKMFTFWGQSKRESLNETWRVQFYSRCSQHFYKVFHRGKVSELFRAMSFCMIMRTCWNWKVENIKDEEFHFSDSLEKKKILPAWCQIESDIVKLGKFMKTQNSSFQSFLMFGSIWPCMKLPFSSRVKRISPNFKCNSCFKQIK